MTGRRLPDKMAVSDVSADASSNSHGFDPRSRRPGGLEAGGELEPIAPGGTAAGDSRTLRGIPAIGRGVSGTMPGTSPMGALMRSERPR
jgi:hypothetical protein